MPPSSCGLPLKVRRDGRWTRSGFAPAFVDLGTLAGVENDEEEAGRRLSAAIDAFATADRKSEVLKHLAPPPA